MVKFCPKCGGVMVLKRIDGKPWYVCSKCGYREPVKDKNKERIVRKVDKEKRIASTSKVISVEERARATAEEEKEIMQDYYRDIFMENFDVEYGGE